MIRNRFYTKGCGFVGSENGFMIVTESSAVSCSRAALPLTPNDLYPMVPFLKQTRYFIFNNLIPAAFSFPLKKLSVYKETDVVLR